MAKGAHSAGELADAHIFSRCIEADQVALHLRKPVEQLEAEGRGFGMNPVRAANDRRVLKLDGAALEHTQQGQQANTNLRGSLLHLQGLRGIHNVIRGKPVVQPAGLGIQPLRFQAFGYRGGEGNHVVLHLRLNLLDAGDRKAGLGGNGFGGGGGNHAILGQHGACGRLHLEPAAVFALLSPNPAHRRACIAFDHRKTPHQGRIPRPLPTFDCTREGPSGARNAQTLVQLIE